MKRVGILFLSAAFGLVLTSTGCGDDGEGTGGAGGTTSSTTTTGSNTTGTGGTGTGTGGGTTTGTGGSGGGGNTPAPPKLGKQLDRFGRPAINTALNATFETDMAKQGAAKDNYNQDADPDNWGSNVPEFQKNLAILDSLDTVCGNQLLADKNKNDPSRYTPLAAAMADDRLWLRTDAATCASYLAVEADATGIQKNTDCGGRALGYDVIDISYSALATGNPAAGVGDGVPADNDTKGTTFPYLAAPH